MNFNPPDIYGVKDEVPQNIVRDYCEDIYSRVKVDRYKEAGRLLNNYVETYANTSSDVQGAMNQLWHCLQRKKISTYEVNKLMNAFHKYREK